MRRTLLAAISIGVFGAGLYAQPTLQALLEAHGGLGRLQRTSRWEARGTIEAAGRSTPFALKVKGENSRFEVAGRAYVKQGPLEQWFAAGRAEDRPRPGRHGDQEAYLLPFLPLSELASRYRPAGLREGLEVYVRKLENQRFIAYQSLQNCLHRGLWHGRPARAHGRGGRATTFATIDTRPTRP
jgi:hypothetical protein